MGPGFFEWCVFLIHIFKILQLSQVSVKCSSQVLGIFFSLHSFGINAGQFSTGINNYSEDYINWRP